MKSITKAVNRNKSLLFHISLMVVMLYAAASIYLLIMAVRWFRHFPGSTLNPYSLISYSVTSFILVIALSAYHISTFIRRRKRRSDREKNAVSSVRLMREKRRSRQ